MCLELNYRIHLRCNFYEANSTHTNLFIFITVSTYALVVNNLCRHDTVLVLNPVLETGAAFSCQAKSYRIRITNTHRIKQIDETTP